MKKPNYSLYLAGIIGENKYLENEEMLQRPQPTQDSTEFRSWLSKFEEEFPGKEYPGMSRNDQMNLYCGRILSVLDELGTPDKWLQYTGASSLDKMMENYEKLVLELVSTGHPEMLDAYVKWHDISQ